MHSPPALCLLQPCEVTTPARTRFTPLNTPRLLPPSRMALLRQLIAHFIGSQCGLAPPGYFVGDFQRRIDDAADATNLLFKFWKTHMLIESVVRLDSSGPRHFQRLHHPLLQRNEATKIDTKPIRTPLLKTLDHLCVGKSSNPCRDAAPGRWKPVDNRVKSMEGCVVRSARCSAKRNFVGMVACMPPPKFTKVLRSDWHGAPPSTWG